jgi:hypothetical protein
MATIPALTQAYSARVNVPAPDASSALALHRFSAWSQYMHLTNQHSAGTASAVARDPNSVWTVRYSCSGAVAGSAGDGVDRWGTTFTPGNLVRAASGSAHSWMVLRNAFSGLECCIALNSVTDGAGALVFARSSQPFSGGSTTARPTAPALEEFQAGTRVNPATSTAVSNTFGNDFTTGGSHWSSMLFGPDGRFMHIQHRSGTGLAHAAHMLWRTVGAQAADTRNWYACVLGSPSARGVPSYGLMTGAAWASRYPDGTLIATGGMRGVAYGGNSYPATYGQDFNAGNYYVDPMEFRELAPQVWDRGFFPDMYIVGTATLGASYPSVAAQTHVVVGDLLAPFPVGCIPTF